jgi:hypothetical protein
MCYIATPTYRDRLYGVAHIAVVRTVIAMAAVSPFRPFWWLKTINFGGAKVQ